MHRFNNFAGTMLEADMNYIIEIIHHTIDLSLSMYFKSLRKTIPLLADKIIRDEKSCCVEQITTYLINNTDVGQLIKEVKEQVNEQLILLFNVPAPTVDFNNIDIDLSYESLSEFVNEEKRVLKLIKYADKTANKISGKMISNIVPSMVIKRLTVCCAKTITKGMGINVSDYHNEASNLVKKHLTEVLAGIESDLRSHLKYQLADQLYSWYEQKNIKTLNSFPQTINDYA